MKYRVLDGWRFPFSNDKYLPPGTVFEAEPEKVKPYHWMVEIVKESAPPPPPPKPPAPPPPPAAKSEKDPRNPRAYTKTPNDRAY